MSPEPPFGPTSVNPGEGLQFPASFIDIPAITKSLPVVAIEAEQDWRPPPEHGIIAGTEGSVSKMVAVLTPAIANTCICQQQDDCVEETAVMLSDFKG